MFLFCVQTKYRKQIVQNKKKNLNTKVLNYPKIYLRNTKSESKLHLYAASITRTKSNTATKEKHRHTDTFTDIFTQTQTHLQDHPYTFSYKDTGIHT